MDLYWFFKTMAVKPFLGVRYRVKVTGKQHLPKVKSSIVAANHLAKVDSFIIAARIKNKLIFGAKKEYFAGKSLSGRLMKWFMKSVDQMPVDRAGRGLLQFIKDSIGVLKRKRRRAWIGIHIEGTRSPDGRFYKPRLGVAKVALATHVPIVPTALIGTNSGRTRWWRRIPVSLVIGKPIHFEEYKDLKPAELADLIGRRIQELSGQEYADEHAPIVFRDTLK